MRRGVRALIHEMRAMCVIGLIAAACGGATPAVTASQPVVRAPADAAVAARPDAAPDAAPDAMPDAAEAVGAMPVPVDDEGNSDPWKVATLDEVDTSVSIDDVKGVPGPWKETRRSKLYGRVMVVLVADGDGVLRLMTIEGEGPDQDGAREVIELEHVKPEAFGHAFDGNAYLSRQGVEETGPIVFAARVLPAGGGERVQIVVYSVGAELRVVEKALSATAWRARLRVSFRRGATFVGIGTSDPH